MKILFAATPVPGHLAPLLALARLVLDRGDEALFATGSHMAGLVEAAGATFLPLAADADLDVSRIETLFPERAALPPGPRQPRFDFERVFLNTMAPQAATLRTAIAIHGPDLVVTDSAFMGRLPLFLDDSRPRPPIVACGITALSLARPDGAPFGPGLPPATTDAERDAYAAVAAEAAERFNDPIKQVADAELAAFGLPALPCPVLDSVVLMADLYLQPTVPAFEYPIDPLPDHVRFVGALPPPPVPDVPHPAWLNDLDGPRQVVLVTQGTLANADFSQLVEPTLAALADRDDVLVVVTTGGRPLDSIRGPIPANARLATFLDFSTVMRRIDVLVTNGGYATVSLALRAGKPIVAAGRTEDKAEVGARVAWSGVGLEIRSQAPSVEELRAAITRVLAEPAFRRKAVAVATDMAAMNPRREVPALFDALVWRAYRKKADECFA